MKPSLRREVARMREAIAEAKHEAASHVDAFALLSEEALAAVGDDPAELVRRYQDAVRVTQQER